jgi:hypothetical protein
MSLLACCVLLPLAANGADGPSVVPADLVVGIELHTYDPQANFQESVQSFSVTCNPPLGVVFAKELCADIAAHPDVMLEHGPYLDGACPAPIGEPWVGVTVDGIQMVGGPGQCDANTAGTLYYAATVGDATRMGVRERWLRCGLGNQAPSYVLTPSILACSLGLWTHTNERLIRAAEQVKAIEQLRPAEIFPSDIGAQSCSISRAGTSKVRALNGQCGVAITPTLISCRTPAECAHVTKKLGPSLPTVVTFVEYWGGGGLTASSRPRCCYGEVSGFSAPDPKLLHAWHVTLAGNQRFAVSQSGAVPPQLSH